MFAPHRAGSLVHLLLGLIAAGGSVSCANAPDTQLETPSDLATSTVTTEYGAVRGTKRDGVARWTDIPYAAPPVGALRWVGPWYPEAWSGVRDAKQFGHDCLQSDGSGDEDCLTLNIWAPADFAGQALPVIVFLHGGDWILGSGSVAAYDGTQIATTGRAIVVTINYRLGALGFLAHPALAAEDPSRGTGNYGLLDQRAALIWIQTNIASFGGDPSRVTLWGQSAGAWSVAMHLASPGSRGLFSRAFSQSGGSYAQPLAEAEATGAAYASQLGCAGSGADVVSCLRALPASAAAIAAPGAGFWDPVIDGVTLTEPVLSTFVAGAQADVPLILGTTRTEFSYPGLSATPSLDAVSSQSDYHAALAANFGSGGVSAIVAQYPTSSTVSPRNAYLAALDDAYMLCPTRGAARAIVGHATEPVWRYLYSHTDQSGPLAVYGPGHFMDVPFWFGTFASQGFAPTAEESTLSSEMVWYLVRFAETGDPNGDGAIAWPRYAPDADPELSFGLTLDEIAGYRRAQCDFWDAR